MHRSRPEGVLAGRSVLRRPLLLSAAVLISVLAVLAIRQRFSSKFDRRVITIIVSLTNAEHKRQFACGKATS
jgi:hypothetical protein